MKKKKQIIPWAPKVSMGEDGRFYAVDGVHAGEPAIIEVIPPEVPQGLKQ